MRQRFNLKIAKDADIDAVAERLTQIGFTVESKMRIIGVISGLFDGDIEQIREVAGVFAVDPDGPVWAFGGQA